MGKYRKKDRPRGRADPISGRPAKVLDAATAALRDQKVLPAVAALRADTKSKTVAATTIANLIEDERCRKLLLREGLVRLLMEDTINDSDLEVACKGWGILRNLALAEQPDFCLHLYRQDILTPLEAAVLKVLDLARRPERPSKAEQALMISLATSLASLLSSLALASEKVLDIVASQPALVEQMINLLKAFPGAATFEEAILYLVYVLTQASMSFLERFVRVQTGLRQIVQYQDTEDIRAALACGILIHVAPEMMDAGMEIPIPQVLETLRGLLVKYAALHQQTHGTFSNGNALEASDPSAVLERTLEVITTVASDVEDEVEAYSQNNKKDEEEFEGFGEESGDDDEAMEGDVTLDEAPLPNSRSVTNGHPQDPDIDMADGVSESPQDRENSATSLRSLQYILHHLTPTIIDLAKPPSNTQNTNAVYTKALDALTSISWTACSVLHPSTPPASIPNIPSRSPISALWAPLAQTIWTSIISPLLSSTTASTALATQTTSLACAIAKSLNGTITLSEPYEYQKFITLYQASRSLPPPTTSAAPYPDPAYSLGSACIGILSALALTPDIERNREIGTFLLSLVVSLPSTSAPDAIEALNALFDVYADAAYPYDQPVFVQGGFLELLVDVLPKVKKMAKDVDRRVDAEGRRAADEAVVELGRFVRYKEDERRGEGMGMR